MINSESKAVYKVNPTIQDDDAIIAQAMAILFKRMKTKGVALSSPDAVKSYLKLGISQLEHEEFHVLFLDNQHQLIEATAMFRGTIDAAAVYPREVAKKALQINAAAVIFAHNHPSGLAEPSSADKAITRKLKDALGLFEIRVLDHIIVGDDFYSFAEHGLI